MEIDFTKKFNVGLTLGASLGAAEKFFKRYAPYVGEVYFSIPLGDRFHTREVIRRQFDSPRAVDKFWKLLDIIKGNGIGLEMVLNTNNLTDEDIFAARDELLRRNVDIESVCFMDEHYATVTAAFPGKNYICSYNNVFRTQAEVARIKNHYDSFVLGSALIRENDVFRYVREEKRSKVILLLNNGCSFNCSGCCMSKYCEPVFLKNLEQSSLEYLYALQSILPPELYDGTIDVGLVDAFKISNRSSSLGYLEKCIDSYMNNRTLKYMRHFYNYSLWARMGQFWPRYIKIDRKKMLACKAEILGHELELK